MELIERNKRIQNMTEEKKKNYFVRRNQILQRNFNDADETRSKSMYLKRCLNENHMKELMKNTTIADNVRNDEKKWSETKRRLWVYENIFL